MNKFTRVLSTGTLLLSACLLPVRGYAQLSANKDKFLGNITTRYQVDYGNEKYYTLWNQITCENESKWGSVEGTKGSFNWSCDNAFNYAKQHGFTYKFHALTWGSQYPGWFTSDMPVNDRYAAIVNWYDAVKKKYPTLPMIDVVNEAIDGHQAGNPMMKESLGGGGKTGYDWLIKAFEMAYERWPEAILIYNDYNTFQWNTDQFIDLVRTLRDAGAPIDAYGCQSHDLTDCSFTNFKTAETKIQTALKMPMYSTEYDIGTGDDNLQLQRYKEQIPYMWEKDYCAGITLWGYIYGATWTTDGNSGIIRDGQDRPAMTWLREYMATEAAQNAKSPFPRMKKEASIYVRPASLNVARGDSLPVLVRVQMASKTVEKVELYAGSNLIATMTEAPYLAKFASTTTGWNTLRAVVTATDGTAYERLSRVNVVSSSVKRAPFGGAPLQVPGTIAIGEYDQGASGVTYYNTSRTLATLKDGAWMDYTVDVAEDGIYAFDAEVAASASGGMFHLAEYSLEGLTYLSEFVGVPRTGGIGNYQTLHGQLVVPLTAGRHVLSLLIDKGGFRIRNLALSRYEEDKTVTANVSTIRPSTISVGDTTVITVTARSSSSDLDHVCLYANNLLVGTLTEAPFQFQFAPTEAGTYAILAVATNVEGKSRSSYAKNLKVNAKRTPYKGTITIPGTIEAENFDKGGDGLTFHDSDATREGDTAYRTDAEGVDFVKGNGGTCIGYTAAGEWLEYSINVTEQGQYSYEAVVSSGTTGGSFNIGLINGSRQTTLAKVSVPKTGDNDWSTYETVTGELSQELTTGNQILRLTVVGANFNIDKLRLICTLNTGIDEVSTIEPRRPVYNLHGVRVGDNYKGIVIIDGRKVLRR